MPKKDPLELINTMNESQWRNKNWDKTLKKHKKEIEKLLQKITIFDIWSNSLQNNEVAKRLIPEIFIDSYISIHFSCFGLYKYAHVCLRSQLETVLRLIFFSTHPVEFDWWTKGNEQYRSGLSRDVWGEGYKYFEELENVKKFEGKCDREKRLFRGKKINRVYKKLSRYVHSGPMYFQTKPDEFSPRYELGEFRKWIKSFKEVQELVSTLLALSFPKEFKKMSRTSREKIIKTGIESSHYRKVLRKTLST